MADEVARPKIVLEVDHRAAIAAFIETGEASKDLGAAIEALGKQFTAHAETSAKSERSIKKMMDTIGGGGATAKFNELAQAVERMGGIEKLTADQTEALVKQMERLKAQGGQVPAALDGIGLSVKRIKDGFTTLGVDMDALQNKLVSVANTNVGTALAGGIAAAATAVAAGLAAAGKAMVDYSSEIIGVHEKTGLTTDTIQKLKFVAEQTDVPFEKLSAGAVKLQRTLGEGSDKTEAAVRALGLSLADLRNMSPDQQLGTVLEKVSAIENPTQRAAVAAQLLGKSFSDLLPVGSQMGTLSEQAERLGLVMTEGSLRAAEQLGDEFSALGDASMGVVRTIGEVITSNESLHILITGLTDIVADFSKTLQGNRDGMSSWVSGGVLMVAQGLVSLAGAVDIAMTGFDALSLTWKSLKNLGLELILALARVAQAIGSIDAKKQAGLDENVAALRAEIIANSEAANATVDSYTKRAEAVEQAKASLEKLQQRVEEAGSGQIKLAADTQKTVKPFKDEAAAAKEAAAAVKEAAKEAKKAAEEEKKYQAAVYKFADDERKKKYGTAMGPTPEELGVPDKTYDEIQAQRAQAAKDILAQFQMGGVGIPQMMSAGLIVPQQLVGGIKSAKLEVAGAKQETKDWAKELQNVANVADFMPSLFGDILGSISGAGTAIQGLSKSLEGGLTGGAGLFSGKGLGSLFSNISGGLQLAGIGLSVGKAVFNAFHQSESEKIAKDVGRDFGVKISEELAKTIEGEKRGRFDGALLHLGELIGEAGGLESFGAGRAAGAMRDLFSAVDRGTISLGEAGKVFDEVFGDVAAAHVSKTTGIASAQLRELIVLASDFGIESEALREFMKGQATGLAGNIAGGLGALKSAREAAAQRGGTEVPIGLAGQGSATALSGAIVGDFAAMQAAGMSAAEALQAIAPSVAAMREELNAAGLEGSAAFAALEERIRLTTDEVTGPLIAGIGSFTGAMVNMHNMNMLTQEDFAGITAQIGTTILALEEQGVVGPAAAQALQPDLQKIWELQQATGYAVDETTQNLIDQAVEAGLVGESHRSAADKMAEASERTAKAVEFLAQRFGYLADEVNRVPSEKTIKVKTEYSSSGDAAPPGGGYTGGREPEYFQGGSAGFRDFGVETPAFLHGLEAVVTPDEFSRITSTSMLAGAEMLARAASRPATAGGVAASSTGPLVVPAGGGTGSAAGASVVININGANKDPKQIADEVAYVLTRGQSPALLDEIRKRTSP